MQGATLRSRAALTTDMDLFLRSPSVHLSAKFVKSQMVCFLPVEDFQSSKV